MQEIARKPMQEMSRLENIKERARNIPEFSTQNYYIAGYIVAALITISGFFLIYEALTTDLLMFKANWNMFKSPLGFICFGIGLLCSIIFWGRFGHWSRKPVIEERDSHDNLVRRYENMDIVEQLFHKLLFPILGHFIIEPLVYGALIYYPIQCVIAIVGAIFPYILSLIILCIIACAWLFTHKFQFRYHSVVLIVGGAIFIVGFTLGGYAIMKADSNSTIQMVADIPQNSSNARSGTGYGSQMKGSLRDTEDELDEPIYDDEYEDNQFGDDGEVGLMGSLPDGTTFYTGEMGGFPIELTITKNNETGVLEATYKNIKYGTTLKLVGESLPAMGGDINFFGNDNGNAFSFDLTGTADLITGMGYSGNTELKVTLHKK